MTSLLTRELIAAVHPGRVVDDPSVMRLASEEELKSSRDEFLNSRPAPHEDLWVFAYGSLMWKPGLEFAQTASATALGWHRRFCLWQWRYRGSRERPGLMLALDRGGSCAGLAYRVTAPNVGEKIWPVWRREMIGIGYRPRWLKLNTTAGRVHALGFVVNPASPRYAGRLELPVVADHIATACGGTGPSAEYLLETHEICLRLGIKDRMLSQLHDLVAERLERAVQAQ